MHFQQLIQIKQKIQIALLAISAVTTQVHAATLLDTGTPDGSGFPLVLDGTDYVASEFHLNSGITINNIAGYLTSGNNGDTFTVALYQDNNGHVGTQLQSTQATFVADGWNDTAALNWNAGPGNYWVAFEVSSADNFASYMLPLSSPNHALATAFNDGSGYHNFVGFDYGVRVTGVEAVPLPGAMWLFASAVGVIAARKKQRV
ncbi:MAG TPA: hypothetical protein VGK97_11810 [Spongiibacteraceae bacterium]|jgi:hypothetical protein